MKLIHITDPHFDDRTATYSVEKVRQALVKSIKEIAGDKILLVSGDVTFQGKSSGYESARQFFEHILTECEIPRPYIIACPGNHDIQPEAPWFAGFNSFIYSLRRDRACTFGDTYEQVVEINDFLFLIANSAFHGNHQHGLIADSTLDKIRQLKYTDPHRKKILICHHHLVGIHPSDISAIRNAHQLLAELSDSDFSAVVHGHQHCESILLTGKNTIPIISGRSLNYHDRGVHNGLNIIDLEVFNVEHRTLSYSNAFAELKFEAPK